MNITITFPPCADPSLPYGALPLLGAILKRAGYDKVLLRDLNLEVFDDLLRVQHLTDARGLLHQRLAQPEDERLGPPEQPQLRQELIRIYQSSEEVLQGIDDARRVLKDPDEFYNPPSLLYAKRIFNNGCALLSAHYRGISFGKYSYSIADYDNFDEIQRAIKEDENRLLTRYFREVSVPGILETNPDVVGLSIPYFSQLIPAFILARLLKEKAPHIHVTLGGPVPTWGKHVLASDPRFGEWIDSVAIGEADQTILELCESIEGKRARREVRNFIIYSKDGVSLQEDYDYKVDLNWLPTPDFAAMPIERYFAPKRIICMVPTRGCYFNRCTFCNYAFIKLAPYRARDPQLIAQDVQRIKEQTGEDVFCFESDVMLPQYLRLLSQALIDHDAQIKWHAVARFEKGMDDDLFGLMSRGGCIRLYMGMESTSRRVLKLMDKGTTPERIEDILGASRRAGIAIEAGVFGNFPSETIKEAEETYRFVKEHRREVTRCDVGEFRLLRGTPIASNPERFGIRILGNADQKWYHLQYEELSPKPLQIGAATPMQKIQALYPEVALVDVPEDILYTAKHGPNAFGEFLNPTRDNWTAEFQDWERPSLSDDFMINRAYVSNSGSVLFIGMLDSAPAFGSSEISLLFALNRKSNSLHPLDHIDMSIIELSRGVLTFAEVYEQVAEGLTTEAESKGTGEQITASFKKLLELGILIGDTGRPAEVGKVPCAL